jgi:Phage portal protein
MPSFNGILKHAWNAFTYRPDTYRPDPGYGSGGGYGGSFGGGRPDRTRPNFGNERTIISSVYTRISIDVASINIRHVRTNNTGRYVEDMVSTLQECLSVQPNIDQGPDQFVQDLVMTLFDKGVAVICPIDTSTDPRSENAVDILSMRVGWVCQWMPRHVRLNVYNDLTGLREEIVMPKSAVAIIENPLYSVMNEPNSTLQRLIRKLNLLDVVDDASASGKLDLIVQLPYTVRSEAKRQQAEQRRKDIEFQLVGSKYGIAYTDGTEKITQLNRPVENNLMNQIEMLTKLLYSQLGITEAVMDGTADEAGMLNYINRTLQPILRAIVQAMKRSFLTKTARTQGQSLMYFRDVFALVPVSNLADIADKFTRNEIASANEMRGVIGWAPSDDPKANMLINSNMPQPALAPGASDPNAAVDPNAPPDPNATDPNSGQAAMGQAFDDIEGQLDAMMSDLGIPVDNPVAQTSDTADTTSGILDSALLDLENQVDSLSIDGGATNAAP